MIARNDDVAGPTMPERVASFRLGEDWFGLDVLRVQEVMTPVTRTPVPRAPGYVLGLINMRGLILTSISLRVRLGLDLAAGDDHMNVVVRTNDGPVCLVVDEIGDVIETSIGKQEARPPTVVAVAQEYITGVLRLEARLITLLDVDRLIAA